MYAAYFDLRDNPFSITPDPSYLYMSRQHRDALAHLIYGTGEDGGFVQLTGEVGTGKTTLIRTLLEQHIENVEVALCLNPRLTVEEFVATICDELHIAYSRDSYTLKSLVDALNTHLLNSHAQGRRTVVIIDEAQNLSREVLEQVRLLTNLETHRHKLLRIILVGQPELQKLLERQDMRQLAQRITARYHLQALNRQEAKAYILHRLRVAGGSTDLFTSKALRAAYRLSGGIPRLLNVICDRALLAAYSRNLRRVNAATLRKAAHEALQNKLPAETRSHPGRWLFAGLLLTGLIAAGWYLKPALLPVQISSLAKIVSTTTTPPPSTDAPAPVPTPAPTPAPAPDPIKPIAEIAPVPLPAAAKPVGISSFAEQADLKVLFEQVNDNPLESLLTVWQEAPDIPSGTSLCEYLKTRTLRCLSGRGNWDQLRRYNHPAILRLATPKGEVRQVLLRSLDEETATLELAGTPLPIKLSLLDLLWTGDYLLLWRPQLSLDFIGPGYQGEGVRWLRQQLARSEGLPPPQEPVSDYFDSALREQVQRFQRSHDLHADGLVGARTMIYLNHLAPEPGTPFLTKTLIDKPK